ncbi:hypothetical protein RHMOL_Rhmol07G0069400 [Rhododendron molle]|uniref:Uncharacterized protein n=2 Tax=Rhododendron molle TaxID=49168 RepID=A0ACC0MZ43_RHOML|nr:hypothetical protein RHMOL_Rhmol07G0069400 [Rhododendron molle]KAI8545844.1 hypothetical protein RHMOL_Rhmol07G0069400 [Rhododendron molle]
MKRLRSSEELDSFGEKGVFKDWGRRDEDSSLSRSSSHRSFHYKSENGRKGLSSSSSSRYDRIDDDRESSRPPVRKRSDYDPESYDRRVNYDRYRDGGERGVLSSSPRSGYGSDRIHRSESFSATRREFPKGFRSERDRSRRADSVSSWKRFGLGKDADESTRTGADSVRGSKVLSLENKGNSRSPQGPREAKSPTWSKDLSSENKGNSRSPQGPREAKSPTWSKDSGSEQSKSVEVKKGEYLPAEGGSSSEMEEGELEPEPEPKPDPAQENEPAAEEKCAFGEYPGQKELDNKHQRDDSTMEDGARPESEIELDKDGACEKKQEVGSRKIVKDMVKEVDQSSNGPSNLVEGTHCNEDAAGTTPHNGGSKKEESPRENNYGEEERNKDTFGQKLLPTEEKREEDKGIDAEVQVGDVVLPESNKESSEGSRIPETDLSIFRDGITQNFKDKGKSVAVSSSNGREEGEKFERDDDLEGPSTRGLELFFRDPVKQPEKSDVSGLNKPKDEKLVLESLDLSLSLPNVLLPINSHNIVQAPGSPSHARSAQSFPSTFLSNSDGFTASMSFSGSQLFTHNPSCSLTHNSVDYEKSVGSKPLFQGVDWNVQPPDDQKHKEVPMHSRVEPNGNGFYHQSQASQSLPNGQGVRGQLSFAEGSSTIPFGLDHQLSLHRQLSGVQSRHQIDGKTPSNSVGSHENGSEYSRDKRRVMRERESGTLYRSSSQNVKEPVGGSEIVEPIITMIVSEPVLLMAKKCSEMTGQVIACLKDSVRDIISNTGKRWQLSAFQKALQNRSDITLEMLLKSNRVQMEILVALRTGLQEFLQRNDISVSDLAEIFLNLRCRNLACRSILPVDECDCKVCAKKSGFCSSCMCLVCSKFDMASNTCSWVGCDVCLHWCHADCALRESYIRNGRSASGPHGSTEMQFHCVACDHPSEMFGFVKEVFQSFAKEWTAETLSKELEYVRRIFSASEDVRGKRLHNVAVRMLSRLANKSDLREVQHQIMGFLTESDSFKPGSNTPLLSGKEVSKKNQEGSNGIAGSSQEAIWFKQLYAEKAPKLERSSSLLPTFSSDQENKHTSDSDSRRSAQKGPVFDELESIVRIKHAEAGMFQTRADDARREAEGLKRIAMAKNEKIEDEYTSRIAKLRLSEAEEMRKQKVEELQVLERAHREYFNMKTRMEADIKDLLSKMEATKRNLSM